MKLRKFWLAILIVMAISCLVGGIAACKPKEEDPEEEEKKEVVLADFEQWAPDFQLLRLMEGFGSIDVNEDAQYVKSGKQSAKLYIMGSQTSTLDPYFYVPTASEYFSFNYSDFKKFDKVTAWFYNPTEDYVKVEIGAVTEEKSITSVTMFRGATVYLEQGWNYVEWAPNVSVIATAHGFDDYDGVKGIFFRFEKSGATSKAEAPVLYLDDIILHYGEKDQVVRELDASELERDEMAENYVKGNEIWKSFTPIPMKEFEGRAIYFEFKMVNDGDLRFIFSHGWNSLTGQIWITKSLGEVTVDHGKIDDLGNNWYGWTLNRSDWTGAYLSTDDQLDTFVTITVAPPTTDVSIFWPSVKVVDAYDDGSIVIPSERPYALHYADGDGFTYNFNWTGLNGIPMEELKDKAIYFELGFDGDSGSFTFAMCDADREWANISGTIAIVKAGDELLCSLRGSLGTSAGLVEEVGDGWYSVTINYDAFVGDGLARAQIFDLAYAASGAVFGGGAIDWGSFKVVDPVDVGGNSGDGYPPASSRNSTNEITAGDVQVWPNGGSILTADLVGKAFSIEFKVLEGEGTFGFCLCETPSWAVVAKYGIFTWKDGELTVEKRNGDGSPYGRLLKTTDGWYAWQLNYADMDGDGKATAENIGFFYSNFWTDGITVSVDKSSFKVVDAFENEPSAPSRTSTQEVDAGGALVWPNGGTVEFSALEGKAYNVEFKVLSGEGSFCFALLEAVTWKTVATHAKFTWKNGELTVANNKTGKTPYGKLTALADGWYSWTLNFSEMDGDGKADASNIGFIYTDHWDSGIVVSFDKYSLKAVDAYENTAGRSGAVDYNAGETQEITLPSANQFTLAQYEGKAIHFEFKLEEDGYLRFIFAKLSQSSLTGEITITRSGSTITANVGRVYEVGGGWWAFELNRVDWTGGGLSNSSTTNETPVAKFMTVTAAPPTTNYTIDWNSVSVVDAYEIIPERTSTHEVSADGEQVWPNGGNVDIADLEGKAYSVEFKVLEGEGTFGFALLDSNWKTVASYGDFTWQNGELTVVKSIGGVSPYGKLTALADGWYSWTLNFSEMDGDGKADAINICFLYTGHWDSGVVVSVDKYSLKAVDAYEVIPVRTSTHEVSGADVQVWPNGGSVSISDLEGKAYNVEFKVLEGEGSFRLALLDTPTWKTVASYAKFTWQGGEMTVVKSGTTNAYGKLTALADGWYSWTLNFSEMDGDGKADATNIGFVYSGSWDAGIVVSIDKYSLKAVDAY